MSPTYLLLIFCIAFDDKVIIKFATLCDAADNMCFVNFFKQGDE